jgi:aspartyl-tRNA(Asn)/glutamyl-tRNA(Gln) amidotransferase subunit A
VTELAEQTLVELRHLVAAGEASCRDVVQACLDRVAAVDSRVQAFVRLRAEEALREAGEADAARARGDALGPLHGLPIAVKDILCSTRFETTCASRILAGFRSPYDATVVRKIREAGLVVIGSLNMDEFAMGSSTENSSYRATQNPWDTGRIPGGSSGGSAAAVASREVPWALGSDTGGSIRQPAALCGVVGMKPTYGRVSRYGLVAFASSLDQIGPLSRTVEDAATLLGVISGHDPHDSTSLPLEAPDYTRALTGCVDGLRLGIPAEFFDPEGNDPETLELVQSAIDELVAAGAKPVDISLPHTRYGIAAYYLICTAEASSNLSRYDGVRFGYRAEAESLDEMYKRTRSRGFGPEVQRRILLGTFVLSAGYYDAYYRKAQKVRTLLRRDFDAAFERCDVIATPTTPGPAWLLGERVDDPLRMYLSDAYNVTVNLAGLPGLSIPCGFTRSRLPAGLQLIGKPLDEETLLRVGDAYQRRTDWHAVAPPV